MRAKGQSIDRSRGQLRVAPCESEPSVGGDACFCGRAVVRGSSGYRGARFPARVLQLAHPSLKASGLTSEGRRPSSSLRPTRGSSNGVRRTRPCYPIMQHTVHPRPMHLERAIVQRPTTPPSPPGKVDWPSNFTSDHQPELGRDDHGPVHVWVDDALEVVRAWRGECHLCRVGRRRDGVVVEDA